MLRRSAPTQLRFPSDFGPFWPPFWSPLAIILETFGTQGHPGAPKGASRAPPGIPLGPQGSTKAPPRSLRPRPGHQNDPSGIDFGGSGPPFWRLRAIHFKLYAQSLGSEGPWEHFGRTLGPQRGARRSFWMPRGRFGKVFAGPKVISKHSMILKGHGRFRRSSAPSQTT